MMNCRKSFAIVAVVWSLVGMLGCNRFPPAPQWPRIDAKLAGRQAIETFDTNGDGLLSEVELTDVPSLAGARKRLDANADGQISADEITARIDEWLNSGTTLVEVIAMVTLAGKPLENAEVTIEPETFLGDDYHAVAATTDDTGMATFSGHDGRLPGLHLGFYRVRISRLDAAGRETLAAEYNDDSTLGIEIAGDKSNLAVFAVSTK